MTLVSDQGRRGVPLNSHEELRVWQKAMELMQESYAIARLLPHEELFVLSAQIRGASESIPSNIAEGYGSGSRKEYRRFLWMARRSALKLQTHLAAVERLAYVSHAQLSTARELLDHTSRMLTRLRKNLPP